MTEILKLGGAAFQPSSALTGNEQASILRGQNMMLRGSEGSFYFEVFGGIKDLNEPIPMGPMTGTLDYTANDPLIRGTATLFKAELRPGMKLSAAAQVLVVDDVLSDTRFVASRPPDADGTAVVPAKFPILFEVNNKRGTLVWGNAVRSDRGNIVAVGEGNLRINGQPLAGEELHASHRVKLAIYRAATDDYEIGKIGFDTAPLIAWVSISTVTGGTRDMTQGLYSYRYSWANSETAYGFSNPSEVIKLDASSNPIAINATNQRHRLDFTTALAHRPSNADAVIIYRSLFSDPIQNETQAGEGSWFVAKTVKIADFETGDVVYIDVLDGELGTEVTFDNDPPPNADWVTFLGGDPILISCYGEKTTTNDLGESPGPFVSIAKRQNRDAFPAELSTPLSPPDTIIGFVPSVGRLFLLTRVGLPFAASTGQSDFPVTTRAFWQTGFKSPFGLVFINDTLYGFTSKGMTRSISTGDEGSEQYTFASWVEDITRDWYAGHVHAVHDPQNELAVFIYSAAYKNNDGFWVSLALPLYLRYGIFGPLVIIEKPNRDMVVCGAAKVEGHLQFLAGGRGAVEVLSSEELSVESSEESSEEAPLEPGPVQWLKADALVGLLDGDEILAWEDSSAFNNDGDAVTGHAGIYKLNQINSLPAARLDGSSVSKVVRLTIDNSRPSVAAEMMIVLKKDNDPSLLVEKSGSWQFISNITSYSHYPYVGGGNVYDAFATTNRKSLGNPVQDLTQWHIYNPHSTAGDWAAYINGTLIYSTVTNAFSFVASSQLGLSNVVPTPISTTPRFVGYIAEYILWDQVLTSDERDVWTQYLKSKYNIA